VFPASGSKLKLPSAWSDTVPPETGQSNGAVMSPQPTMPETVIGGPPSGSKSLSRTPKAGLTVVVATTFGAVLTAQSPAAQSTSSSVLPMKSKVSATAVGGSSAPWIVTVSVEESVNPPSEAV
jgi:hypothetical protein